MSDSSPTGGIKLGVAEWWLPFKSVSIEIGLSGIKTSVLPSEI